MGLCGAARSLGQHRVFRRREPREGHGLEFEHRPFFGGRQRTREPLVQQGDASDAENDPKREDEEHVGYPRFRPEARTRTGVRSEQENDRTSVLGCQPSTALTGSDGPLSETSDRLARWPPLVTLEYRRPGSR